MKEFRVAKCLENGKIGEYAIFSDGSRKKAIQTDDQYGRYFYVDNELNTTGKHKLLRSSFTGRVKDAVDTIRNGNGDCIQQTKLMFQFTHVCYFLDREIGEKLRAKSIEGFKDTKFGWSIEVGNRNSMSGYAPIKPDGSRLSVFDEDRSILTFDKEEDAEAYIQKLINQAKDIAKTMSDDITKAETKDAKGAAMDASFKKIEEVSGTRCSVLESLVCDMVNGDGILKSEDSDLDNWGYDVVQCIIQ